MAASWIRQNASPPTLVMCGYTTERTADAAMAASIADPPARSTSTPAADASVCGLATMPDRARAAAWLGRPIEAAGQSGRSIQMSARGLPL